MRRGKPGKEGDRVEVPQYLPTLTQTTQCVMKQLAISILVHLQCTLMQLRVQIKNWKCMVRKQAMPMKLPERGPMLKSPEI